MEWYKLVGMGMVVLATTGYGIVLGRDIKYRLKELKELKKIFFLLKGEICFGHSPILDALETVSGRCSKLFKGILQEFVAYGRECEKKPFGEIWQEGMKPQIEKTHLSKEERERFINLGNELGLSDLNTQQNAIDNFNMELEVCISELEKTVPGKVKLYNSMGVLLGLVIAIIMI